MRINADLPDDRFNWCDALELLLPVILSLLGTKKRREVGDWNSEVNLEQKLVVFIAQFVSICYKYVVHIITIFL